MASIKRAGASLGVGQISLILCAQILAGEEKGGMTFLMSFILKLKWWGRRLKAGLMDLVIPLLTPVREEGEDRR